jgi:hypothetical protein
MSQKNVRSENLVIICSSWSSGSTAVTGYLDLCGAYTCPPHIKTNDTLTPNSFESKFFRDLVAEYTDELSLRRVGKLDKFRAAFPVWLDEQINKSVALGKSTIVLKHPLASFLLEEIDKIIPSTKYVVVTRKFDEIENSRLRRGWNGNYGSEGANKVYNHTYTFLHEHEKQFHVVPYKLFLSSHSVREALLDFVALSPDPKDKTGAEKFIKR